MLGVDCDRRLSYNLRTRLGEGSALLSLSRAALLYQVNTMKNLLL